MTRILNFNRTHAGAASQASVIHVRFGGNSFDVPLSNLDLGIGSDDRAIKRALGGHMHVPADRLDDYVIDRHANGNLTIRPEAVFG